MKRKLNFDDLEDFLADNAEELRMQPSDKVWHNIDSHLHAGKRKWPALTFISIAICGAVIASLFFIYPNKNIFDIDYKQASIVDSKVQDLVAKNGETKSQNHFILQSPPKKINNSINDALPDYSSKAIERKNTTALVNENKENINHIEALSEVNADALTRRLGYLFSKQSGLVFNLNKVVHEYLATNDVDNHLILNATVSDKQKRLYSAAMFAGNAVLNDSSKTESETEHKEEHSFENRIVNSAYEINLDSNQMQSLAYWDTLLNTKPYFESIKTELIAKKEKWQYSVYAAPSSSYRNYEEEAFFKDPNAPVTNRNGLNNMLSNNIDQYVKHRANFGFELGAAIGYKFSSNLTVKVGAQLNYRGYEIDAFKADNQVVELNFSRGVYVDSVRTYSDISNSGGFETVTLKNKILQLSVPVFFNLDLLQYKKLTFSVEGGVQPTFNLMSDNYILSTDYNHYFKRPSLNRAFNINTQLSTLFNYKIKNVTLFAGPQIRYQLLSNYKKQYPVKEHLMDYGIKLGFYKTFSSKL